MIKRAVWVRAAAAIAAAGIASLVAAAPASAASSPIQFGRIYYDSPGYPDRGGNTSINGEWVIVRNYGTTTVNLYHWRIADAQHHVYVFTSTFYLHPGHYVTIHSGYGTNTSMSRYWESGWYIWNNTGDKAYLRRPNGTQADYCSWYSDHVWKQCTRQ